VQFQLRVRRAYAYACRLRYLPGSVCAPARYFDKIGGILLACARRTALYSASPNGAACRVSALSGNDRLPGGAWRCLSRINASDAEKTSFEQAAGLPGLAAVRSTPALPWILHVRSATLDTHSCAAGRADRSGRDPVLARVADAVSFCAAHLVSPGPMAASSPAPLTAQALAW
jgi:hypothetical protein